SGSADLNPTNSGVSAAESSSTYDPNYQTLAGVQGDVFGADKKKPAPNAAAPAAAGPQKPAVGNIMAGTYDPNYQTLAGVQGDVFGPDKKESRSSSCSNTSEASRWRHGRMLRFILIDAHSGTYDPNYQTLAGMNADVFGADKKK
ncbi:hypothetical protein OSTOST_19217, partial [Ostertagia ostertagi]